MVLAGYRRTSPPPRTVSRTAHTGATEREEAANVPLPMAVKGVLKMMEPTMVSGILLNEPTCAPACTPGPAVKSVPYINNTTQVHAAGETGRTMEVVVGEVRPMAQKEHMEMPTEQDPLRKSNTQNDGIDHASLCVASHRVTLSVSRTANNTARE